MVLIGSPSSTQQASPRRGLRRLAALAVPTAVIGATLLSAPAANADAPAAPGTLTVDYSSGPVVWTVPAGTYDVWVTAVGGSGADGSDLDAFEAALDGDQPAKAVSLYLGPFLDGFFLKGAPEFDRWAEAQRDRLARRFQSAISSLARRSAAAGEWESAIDWWRRGIDANPLDPQAALGLLEALIESGDRPAAIRYAREYEERLRSELEVAPDPAFTSLVDRTR